MKRSHPRRAAAMVEAAICLPVFMFVVLGMLQLLNMLYFRQKVSMAGFIGMQALAQPNANDQFISDRLQQVLDERGLKGATIEIEPPGELADAPLGRTFKLILHVPMRDNIPYLKLFPIPQQYTVNFTLYR